MTNRYLDCLAAFGVGGAHPGGLQLTKEMLSGERIEEGMEILDAGCGTGQTAAYIAAQFGCRVTAVDSSRVMAEKAEKRLSTLQLPATAMEGDIHQLPFSDQSFDLILVESVFVFTDVQQSIPECKRLLKPGGKLLSIELVLEAPLPSQAAEELLEFYGIPRLLTEKEWVEQFRFSGFTRVSAEKPDKAASPSNLDNAPDFMLSDTIVDEMHEVLADHWSLSERYHAQLGYRIFRCQE